MGRVDPELAWKIPTTGQVVLLVATLLVPLNLLAFAAFVVDDDADGEQVVDLIERLTLIAHLVVDRHDVLRAAVDVDLQPGLLQLLAHGPDEARDVGFALAAMV